MAHIDREEPESHAPAPGLPAQSRGNRWAASLREDRGTRLLVEELRTERRLFGLTVLFLLMGAALEGVGIGLLIPFLDNLLNPEAEPLRSGWAWFDRHVLAIESDTIARLYRVAGVILLSIWLRALVSYLGSLVSVRMTESILDRLRRRMVDQIQSVSISFFSAARSGDLLNTMTTELNRLQTLFAIARMFLIHGLMILTYSVVVLLISWELAVFTFFFCGLIFGALSRYLRKLKDQGRIIAESRARLAAFANDLIGGVRTVTEFGTQRHEAERFAGVSGGVRADNVQAFTRSALVGPVSQGIAATTLIILIVAAVQILILPGLMSTAALFAFLVVLLRMLPLLQSVNTSRAEWAVFRGALDRVVALLRRDDKPYLAEGHRPLGGFEHAITLENVSFGYEDGQRVLEEVDLEIRRGEVTAIVGASGSGKSTLVDLVARLYDPDEGAVLYDGVDVREIRTADLRRQVAIVNQHTFLFNDTVYNNIAYGLEDVTEEEVRAAAEEANALPFIEAMPEGFDTVLGERGTRLSGGQRQRIAIARALLRDASILILDEATSALDSVSENLVHESMERLMEGRTVIIIAHRLSTVEHADQVVVLEEGRIHERGSYADLIERRGQLWEYHRLQMQAV